MGDSFAQWLDSFGFSNIRRARWPGLLFCASGRSDAKWAEAMNAFPLPHWEAAETALRAVANAIILRSPSTPVMCHSGGVSKQDDGCATRIGPSFPFRVN